ncbi:dynein regulatory complex subunit 2 isoform X2 [Helicoverpa armigera]|uniref:dynein regulatory complex subunit 2 isoform X2 n=1 Tax=Helicoverpa armigera TaxID=29058 RepID=UPI0030839EA2
MGKKGKVNKLAKMSDEERARYLQHRADMEEEARRRKQELIHRFIKNKLDKEEAYSRLNTAKINQQWRFILRKIKCKQMATDIQNMLLSFNFLLERKNRLLTALMKATNDSDEQHRRAFQAHTENVSYFLNIGYQRLDKLQAEYDHQKNTLLENWDKEEMELVDGQDRAEFKLKLVAYIQDRDFQMLKKDIETQRATEKNDARLEHEEDLLSFCTPKQLVIEMYWTKLREVYKSYQEEHEPIMSHYHSLREKDDFYQKEIAKNDYQIQLASENLMNLQHEWQKTTSTMTDKLTRMASRKEELTRKYLQMKRDSKVESSKSSHDLNIMVNASQDAIKHLEDMCDKVNKILQLAEICSKYEHEGDKLTDDAEYDIESVDFEHLDKDMINECKEYSKMDKFLLKVNRAKVQTLCLKTEKAKLAKENIQLKNYIKRYLTDLALKGRDRPLSMKIRTEPPKVDTKILNRPVTCIEGALSNAVQHEKRMRNIERRNKDSDIRAYPRVQCWLQSA